METCGGLAHGVVQIGESPNWNMSPPGGRPSPRLLAAGSNWSQQAVDRGCAYRQQLGPDDLIEAQMAVSLESHHQCVNHGPEALPADAIRRLP